MFLSEAMLLRAAAARDAATGLHLALPKRARYPETSVQYVRCPVCGTTMNRKAFGRISGVVVDVCKAHGVWFDAGELAEVLAFVERGGLELARRREIEELHEQARKARAAVLGERTPHLAGVDAGPTGLAETARLSIDLAQEIVHALADLWR
jgi:Zn-finger nucleic acid-binding protein